MPLDRDALKDAIAEAFEDAKEKEWEIPQIADALARAIDEFVRGGDVTGIETDVTASVTLPDLTVPQELSGEGSGQQSAGNVGRIT